MISKKLKESIYQRSPVWLQNIMVSWLGYSLRRIRYGGRYKEYLKELWQTQNYSLEQLRRYQEDQAKKLMQYVYDHVPYYKTLFRKIGFEPGDFKGIEDIKKLPVLEKETVRQNQKSLISEEFKHRKLYAWPTSGTTGKPLSIMLSRDALNKYYAFEERVHKWLGLPDHYKQVIISGNIVVPQRQTKPPFWRREYLTGRWHFSSYHLSEKNLKYYYEELKAIQPALIESYPSSLYAIAQYMDKNGLNRIYPRGITTTAETLSEHQREIIEKVFHVKVTDMYGSSELTHFVHQCKDGSYHINPEFGLVEVLGPEGEAVGPGQPGEIVCTGFCNWAMPLIRYRLGDSVVLSDKKCACGLPFPVMEKILGRTDDLIITPDGRKVGRLDPVFKGIKGIKEAQIVQEEKCRIIVNLVAEESFSPDQKDHFINQLKQRIGEEMSIEFNFLEMIPRDKNGKFRSVISRVKV